MSPEIQQLEAVQAVEQTGLVAQSMDFIRGHGRMFAAGVVLGAVTLTGCGASGRGSAEAGSTPAANTSTLPGSSHAETLPGGSLRSVTDTELANGGYNCGHTTEVVGNTYNYKPQIDYLNKNPELTNKLANFQVNDPVWGMGTAAWNVVKAQAYVNENTPQSAVVKGNDIMNIYAHKIATYELDTPLNGLNFTCDGDIRAVDYVGIKTTNHVSGMVFDKKGVTAFEKVAKKGPDGKSMFNIITIKGKTEPDDMFMVVTEYEGCNNPGRAIPAAIEKQLVAGKTVKPSTPETPTTPVTPTTPGHPTPTPTPKPSTSPTPTPSFPKKVPTPLPGPHTQPGAPGTPGASNEPGCDSKVTGYCPGQQPPAPAPAPTSEAPAPAPAPSGVETNPPTATTTVPGTLPPSNNPSTAPATPQ